MKNKKGVIYLELLMTTKEYGTIVVGAGPSGTLAATEIARRGLDVHIFEEHPKVGEPDHCAGLFSSSGLKSLGLKLPMEIIQNQVSGAQIYSPSGHSILIERGNREAFVIDRRGFDAWLAEIAVSKGASLHTETKVQSATIEKGGQYPIKVRLSNEDDVYCKTIINGEGSRGVISKQLGLPTIKRKSKLPAYQFEIEGIEINEDIVEMFYTQQFAPGFFLWIIPLGEGRARVGLAARDKAKPRLKAALQHHPIIKKRIKGFRIVRGLGGIVLVGLPLKKTATDNALLVGDAAGMVKATTGGGVILGGTVAKIAGKTIAFAIRNNDTSYNVLKRYENSWRSSLYTEFLSMYFAQRLITSLTDKGLDSLIKSASELGLVDVVRKEGDMDRQRRVIYHLIRDPRTALAGLKAIRYLNPIQ